MIWVPTCASVRLGLRVPAETEIVECVSQPCLNNATCCDLSANVFSASAVDTVR